MNITGAAKHRIHYFDNNFDCKVIFCFTTGKKNCHVGVDFRRQIDGIFTIFHFYSKNVEFNSRDAPDTPLTLKMQFKVKENS